MHKVKINDKVKCWFWLAAIVLLVVLMFLVNLQHFDYKMNADIASETVLAKLIWDSKQLIPQSWYPSTELRLISTPDISALFYGITKNAPLAMGLGCCLMTIGIIFSIYYFMSTVNVRKSSKLLMIFLCLILPCSFTSLELFYLFASYYAIHVITLFLTLGFYDSCIKEGEIRLPMYLLLLAVSFFLGLQGVRGVLVTWGPLLCVEVVRNCFVLFKTRAIDRKNIKLFFAIAILMLVSYMGTLLPFSVGQNISRNVRNAFSKLVITVIPDVKRAIGLATTNLCEKIILLLLCLASILMLFRMVRRLLCKESLEAFEWSYLVLWVSPILTMLMVAFSTVESSERYFFVLLFTIAMSVVLLMQDVNPRIAWGIGGIIIILSVINISTIYLPVLTSTEPPRSDALAVAEYLVDNDYDIAYASFENASTIAVLEDNEIVVAPVADVSRMDICKWLSSSDWYVPNRPYEEKTAYIITESEKEDFLGFIDKHEYGGDITTEGNFGKYWVFSSNYNYSTLNP